jgi:hypothetical protein
LKPAPCRSARTTAGVAELAAGSGCYSAVIDRPAGFRGAIVWDTGEAAPAFAGEDINPVEATSRFCLVNFGPARKGLATVGYTVTGGTRTTAGISELAVGSGLYGAIVAFGAAFNGSILWDTGDTVPAFACDGLTLAPAPVAPADFRPPLVARLLSDEAITTVVGDNVFPGNIPETDVLPALVYRISEYDRGKDLGGYTGITYATVRFYCSSWFAADCVVLAQALRDSFDGFMGVMSGLRIYYAQVITEDDDYLPPADGTDRGTHVVMQEIKFKFRESWPSFN